METGTSRPLIIASLIIAFSTYASAQGIDVGKAGISIQLCRLVTALMQKAMDQ